MGVEISLWRNEIPIFSGSSYGGLSEQSLHFIGGILKHAKTLNAFGNQSTNSYRRLYPPNPILCAYSSTQENTVCRVPFATSPNAKRVEVRFADPLANPYLLFPALLMAGIDGIMNRIDPGAPVERNLYDVSPSELAKVPVVSESLREALTNLDNNREFLKKGEVFTDEIIDAYIDLKMSEYYAVFQAPHPVELQLASEYAG
jgi:glutamine synthetase